MDDFESISNEAAAKRADDRLSDVNRMAGEVDWDAQMSRQSREQRMSNGLKVLEQMREIQDRNDMDRLNRNMQAQDAIMSAISITPRGGSLPKEQVAYLNDMRGLRMNGDGTPVNGQIMEAGYNPKTGGYGFVTANVGRDGGVSYSMSEMSPAQVYGMMHNYPGIFDEAALNEQKQHAFRFDKSLTEDRLGMFARSATDGYRRMQDRIASIGLRSGTSRSGGGLFGPAARESAEMKQDGYIRKNVMDALKSNMSFQQMLIDDPSKAAEIAFGFEKKYRELTGRAPASPVGAQNGREAIERKLQGRGKPQPQAAKTAPAAEKTAPAAKTPNAPVAKPSENAGETSGVDVKKAGTSRPEPSASANGAAQNGDSMTDEQIVEKWGKDFPQRRAGRFGESRSSWIKRLRDYEKSGTPAERLKKEFQSGIGNRSTN